MTNSGLNESTKLKHMNQLAEYRDEVLRPHPALHSLFFEITVACNEHCLHCGSKCGDFTADSPLSTEEWKHILDDVKRDFGSDKLHLCITGGEPLLNPDFFEIMDYAHKLGFWWGMTSNGTLITPEAAHKLKETGMRTISISVDGLKETHDWFRQSPGSYEKTLAGIKNLLNEKAFDHVQVTTVVHKRNIGELDKMYEIMKGLGIRSWRVINIEPIGRALDNPDLMLTKEDYRYVLDFIRQHRFETEMEVCYGCSHYLPMEYEREVRPWYFLCNAGVYVASIMNNGNIGACLDIERRPELVEGNIRRDNLKDVWENGFKIYRTDYRKCGPCRDCADYQYCAGDSFHTWNFDKMEPYICLKKMLK
ncbi:MAG: radical SAM protein [Lachnospiraceae bacterium]|nr:radical SAM protein [Lachnospiraceae bacterium]